jgi:hypothetical protein
MKLNLNVSALANVCALVNEKNGTLLSDTRVTAGTVEAATGDTGDNSQVTLTGIAGHGYTGSRTYTYDRYDLLGGRDTDPDRVVVATGDTQEQIKAKVCDAHALLPSELIFNDDLTIAIPDTGSEIVTIPLETIPNSLIYLDDIQEIKLVRSDLAIPLSLAIPNQFIPGFDNYPIDITKTGPQNLVAMVNAQYPIGMKGVVSNVTGMSAYTPEAPDTSNTRATINGDGTQFSGSREVFYRRVTLASQKTPAVTVVDIAAGDTQTQAQVKVALALNIVKNAVMFTNHIQPTEGVDGSVTVTPSATTFLYNGPALNITLRLV